VASRSPKSVALPPSPEAVAFRPEFYRLPKPGLADPFFGFSRSFYYQLEKRGALKLFRIVGDGKEKGVTLIRYRDVWDFVQSAVEQQETKA
jgi:hypothetical protein